MTLVDREEISTADASLRRNTGRSLLELEQPSQEQVLQGELG
jgi:hypothetical protein